MAKWDNMLRIVWLLRSRKSMTAAEMAEQLEISVRTIYRYVDALCASGVPIVSDPGHGGGYYLLESFREAPLFFEPDELKSLFHAASFAQGANYPYKQELSQALEKIQYHLNEEQQDYLNRHTSGFEVISEQKESVTSLLQQVEQSVAEFRTMDMLYDKRKGEGPKARRINPYALVYRENYWYIIAYCHMRLAMRTFRVDRISGLSPSGLFFERPDDFSIHEHINQQWNYHWKYLETKEPTVNVQMRGNMETIDYLCRYFSHCLVEHDDNYAHFKISVERVENMLPQFLVSFGTCVQVLGPEYLRTAMAKVAHQLEKYYQTNELP